jgi:large subunit ribosomal protein L12
MEYVYSALLLHDAKQEISEANVKKVLDAAGVKTDETRVKALVASLESVNIDEAVKSAAPVAAAAAPAAAPAEGEKKAEVKKDEKSEEKKEEEAAAGLSALFG